MIEELYKLPISGDWSEKERSVLQKILTHLHEKALGVEYKDSAPTLVHPGKVVVSDDGADQRIYFKTAKGTVAYGDASPSTSSAVEVKNFNRDMTAASGDVEYNLAGAFQPNFIVILGIAGAADNSCCIGFTDGTSLMNLFCYLATTTAWRISTNKIVDVWPTYNSAGQQAVLKQFDADGFTLTWTKTGSPTGTATFTYLAGKLG